MSTLIFTNKKKTSLIIFFLHVNCNYINTKCCHKEYEDNDIKPIFKNNEINKKEITQTEQKIKKKTIKRTKTIKEKEIVEPITKTEVKEEDHYEKIIKEIKASLTGQYFLGNNSIFEEYKEILAPIIYNCDNIYKENENKIKDIKEETKNKLYFKLINNEDTYYIIPDIENIISSDLGQEYKGDINTAIGDNSDIILYIKNNTGMFSKLKKYDITLGLYTDKINDYCETSTKPKKKIYKEIINFIYNLVSKSINGIIDSKKGYLCKIHKEKNKNKETKQISVLSISENTNIVISYKDKGDKIAKIKINNILYRNK